MTLHSGRLAGKITLVTGGASGIGFAAAKRFTAEGASVFIAGRRQSALDAAAREIGGNVKGIRGDISNLSDLDYVFAAIEEQAGRLDILFANAGGGTFVPLEKVTEEDFNKYFGVNVKGTLFTVQKAPRLMPSDGSIILNGSMVSVKGVPAFGIYAATKAAIRSLARTWATELNGRNIRVNVVSPGKVITDRHKGELGLSDQQIEEFKVRTAEATPLGRTGTPEEIAAAVLFLASDESSYITGIELFVDGGAAQI